MEQARFCSRPEYFQELTDFARKAGKGDRIAIATMPFYPEVTPINELTQQLIAAASRGAQVMLWLDAFTFLLGEHLPGPLWYGAKLTTRMPKPFGKRFALLEELRKHGGAYVITNKPKPFTFAKAGRSHIKFAVLGDRIYIGGNNLEDPQQIDVMASWHNKATADFLYQFTKDTTATGSPRTVLRGHDLYKELDDQNTLLIDAGVPGQSLILDEAFKLIDEAEERITMTCQFFPGGSTGQHLASAVKRGVKVILYYSPARTHGSESLGHYAYEWRERARLPAELFTHRLPTKLPKLHAKVLASEKATMIGSHNYVVQGVFFGTAEIALLSKNSEFGQQLIDNFQRL